MNRLIYILFLITIVSCSGDTSHEDKNVLLVEGDWLLEFQLSEKNTVPINFILSKNDSLYEVTFSNADEKITAKKVTISNNKITIKDPLFNTWFEGVIINPTKIEGSWFKNDKEHSIPFSATFGQNTRFKKPENLPETLHENGKLTLAKATLNIITKQSDSFNKLIIMLQVHL